MLGLIFRGVLTGAVIYGTVKVLEQTGAMEKLAEAANGLLDKVEVLIQNNTVHPEAAPPQNTNGTGAGYRD